MKMYKNLQEIALEDNKMNNKLIYTQNIQEEPVKRGKLALKYLEQLLHYDPFSYDIQATKTAN